MAFVGSQQLDWHAKWLITAEGESNYKETCPILFLGVPGWSFYEALKPESWFATLLFC